MSSQQRDLRINLSANTAQLERGMARAGRAMEGYQRSVEDAQTAMARLEMELQADMDRTLAEVEQRAQARAEAWERAGQVMVGVGVALSGALALSARSAIQWESDWTGVTKVLDATPEQVGVLEQQLRDLAKILPVTHSEVAEVAAAAAQLGVSTQHLIGFTNASVALGQATVLSSQDAAMGLARLSTVMGVNFADIDRMGSSLVSLGNNFAAMEDEILEMSLRLSGMGNQVGLTSGQVMGLAAGFSAVGIQAELGGGAFSRALGRIQASVQQGGRSLEDFATVAGMSADEFADAFTHRPNEAIVAFLRGLDQVNTSGGSVFTTLSQLGLTGTEIADVMGRASAAWETVAEAMEVGNAGFEEGNALLEEAAERYATTESQVAMARSSLNDLAIDIGNNLLPMIGEAADGFGAWMTLMQTAPEPVQGAITALGGVGAAAALAAGAFLVGVPKVAEFRGALDTMGPRTQAVGRGLSSITSFLGGPWGVAMAAGAIALGVWIDKKAEAAQRTADFTNALRMDSGELGSNTTQLLANVIAKDDLISKSEQFGITTDDLVSALMGEEEAIRRVEAALEDEATAYVRAADGGTRSSNARASAARDLESAIAGTNDQLEEARRRLDAEADVLRVTEEGARDATSATHGLAGAQQRLAGDAAAASGEVRNLKDQLDALTQSNVDATRSEISFLDAVKRATDGVATNGATLDRNTDSGRRNLDNLLALRDRSNDYTSSVYETTGSVDAARQAHEKGREEFVRVARQMGATADEADALAEEYLGIPAEVKTAIEVDAAGRWAYTMGGRWHGGGAMHGHGAGGLAAGGAVHGPGTGTSDDIPAWLSNGEHVLTAAEVKMLGGQERVYAMRELIRAGALRFASGGAVDAQRFNRGGAVDALPRSARIIHDHREDVRINIQRLFDDTIGSMATSMGREWKKFLESGGAVVAAWRSQLGVPYSWGGGGPGGPGLGFGRGAGIRGFDCSSLMQYGWAKVGVSLPRVTYDQINYGKPVPRGQERPGDLVFPNRGHVAGVSGPGRVIHAPRTGGVVHERPMYPSPLAIRRPGRFDRGGIWHSGTPGENVSGSPERVLSPDQTRAFERLVDGLLTRTGVAAAPAGPQEVHYHVHHVPGFTTERDLHRAEEHRQQRVRAGRRG